VPSCGELARDKKKNRGSKAEPLKGLLKEVPNKDDLESTAAPYRELLYRPTLEGWTPDSVKTAIANADGGNLRELADLVETMIADDRIDGVLASRTHGLLGLPLNFESGSEEAREYLQGKDGVPGEWYMMHPESELVSLLVWGLILGVGLAQRVPLPRLMGQKQRYRLEVWSPRHLRHDATGTRTYEWYVQTDKGEVPIIPEAGRWVLFRPYGSKRPYSKGKWRSLVFPWLLKRFALEDRANHSEVNGSPVWLGKAPQGSTEKQRNRFLSQLIGLGKKGRFVLPEGWDLMVREASSKNYEIYSEAVSWSDQAITIILAGQVVTTEGSPGFSSGNVQDAIKEDFIKFDEGRLSTCLYEQSTVPWAWVNYGTNLAAPWGRWQLKKPVDREQEARTLEMISRAVEILNKELAKEGKKISLVKYLELYDIPIENVPEQKQAATVQIPLAPTDIAKVVRVNEACRSNGLGDLLTPEGDIDERGNKLISELAPSESELLDAPSTPAGIEPEKTTEPPEKTDGI
jgi:hypothetical protein